MAPIVAFLSDFGLSDPYVGIVKGVILKTNPSLGIVDLTHDIPPQDIETGAYQLGRACGYFSEKTIFLAIVDPGVGSPRAGLIVQAGPYFFVAPDNGILSVVFRIYPDFQCNRIEKADFFLARVSSTFHARDVFAPVAAHLGFGVAPGHFGPAHPHPVRFAAPEPWEEGEGLCGEILYADRFGNLVTNLDERRVRAFLGMRRGFVEAGGRVFPLLSSYSETTPGTTLALVGSDGCVELAVFMGSAARILGMRRGERVTLKAV